MLPDKRLQSLQAKKAILAQQIEKAEQSAAVDSTLIRQLKKQKLELKEVLHGIRSDTSIH